MSTEELTRTSNPNTRSCDISEEQKQLGRDRLSRIVLSSKAFGAKADGVSDNTRSIQMLINSVCNRSLYKFDGKNYTLRAVK